MFAYRSVIGNDRSVCCTALRIPTSATAIQLALSDTNDADRFMVVLANPPLACSLGLRICRQRSRAGGQCIAR